MAEKQEKEQQELSEVLRVRREKLAALKEAGRDPYEITTFEKTHHSDEILNHFDEMEGDTVSVAGRIISKRVMGKASFFHILDGKGKLQIYARRDVMGDEPYADYKKSVSYTHLRAHETGRNLVCRLLLEKKN